MRILLLNPNTSVGVTDRMDAVARAVAAPSTEIVPLTAPRGVPYIATRAEALIGAAVALEMLAEAHEGADAVILAAFGDPGLGGLRELAAVPVIGLAEAAMLTACMLGRRFAIVSFARALGPWYEECVEWHGLRSRLAAIRLADAAFASVTSVQDEMMDAIVEVANRTVALDGADVVILAGAPLAGLAGRIADRVPVPLVDGVAAAVRQAETLVCLRPRKASAGSYRRPDSKPSNGLPPALARFLGSAAGEAGLPAILIETRHVKAALKAMTVKTDRNDARGMAQLMRMGWFRPVHVKTLQAQEIRALLTARELLVAKLRDVESSIRGSYAVSGSRWAR